MSYAVIDIVLLVVAIILAIRAALHGFVDEAMGVASVGLGLLFALLFFNEGTVFLKQKVAVLENVKVVPYVLSFIALFLIVFVVLKIFTFILKDIVARIHLGSIDHVLGFVFGIAEGFLVAALVVFVISIQPLFDKNAVLENSIASRVVAPLITTVTQPPAEPE
jgi:membrane protein required for colicin V production